MKKLYMIMLVSLLVVGLVSAGIGIGVYNESKSIDKVYRDELLTKTNAETINPAIDIKCSDDYCLYSVVQEGIINSYNNQISRYYNGTENPVAYTDAEIQDLIAEQVLVRLENFANASIERETYADWGTGEVVITERR